MIKGWDNSGCSYALLPNCLTNGGGVASYNTGSALPYQGPAGPGTVTATFTDMAVAYGYDAPSGSIKFDGVSTPYDFIQTNVRPVQKLGCGIEIWLDNSGTREKTALYTQYASGTEYFQIYVTAAGVLWCNCLKAGVSNLSSASTLLPQSLCHVAVLLSVATGFIELYINGTEVAYTAKNSWSLGDLSIAADARVGYNTDTTYMLKKSLKSVICYSSLTAAKIAATYALGSTMAGIKMKRSGDNAILLPAASGANHGFGFGF